MEERVNLIQAKESVYRIQHNIGSPKDFSTQARVIASLLVSHLAQNSWSTLIAMPAPQWKPSWGIPSVLVSG